MTRDSLFRIASMTKPVTTVGVMMLREQGRIRLDDSVAEFLPEFAEMHVVSPSTDGGSTPEPARRAITIRDLLTHTSGLTYGFFGQQPHAGLYEKSGLCEGLGRSQLTLADSVSLLARQPLTQHPGSGWQYGLSTDVLGRVIEVVSGQPFDEFVRQRILKPLKMHDTHFVVPEAKLDRLATLYRPGEDDRIEANPDRAVTEMHDPGRSNYRSGGAGLVSTAADYHRFLSMLLNQGELDGVRLLKPETVAEMTTNQIGDLSILFPIHGDKFGYGFGIHSPDSDSLNGASPGTYSWGGYFHTYFWVDPKREVIGVLMTQLNPFNHLTLWADFQQAAYDALDASIEVGTTDGPGPGDVYREYAVHAGGNLDWRVTDPRATASGAWKFLPNPTLQLTIDDLEHAVRAEAVIDRWGGHLRTTNKRIRFDGNTWLRVPELTTPPSDRAEYFYSQDNPRIAIPLEHLHEGVNALDGICATRDGYNWGQWGLYSLILRVYYDPAAKPHSTGRIVSPAAKSMITDHPTVSVSTTSDTRRVDVLAFYDGEDEDGDGVYRDWHGAYHQPERGAPAELSGHVGTDRQAPFDLRWDTTWVPDQRPGEVRLVARLQDADGLWTVTEPIEGLTLARDKRHVVIFHAQDVPERFGVRVGRERSCTIPLPAEPPLQSVEQAALSLRTWHGWDGHHSPLKLNGHRLPIEGKNHHYDWDRLPVPPELLKPGENSFHIHSETEHHMLEVLWPGPSLLIRYSASE